MHSGDAMPRVPITARMPDVIYEISKKGLGMTTVVDAEGRLGATPWSLWGWAAQFNSSGTRAWAAHSTRCASRPSLRGR